MDDLKKNFDRFIKDSKKKEWRVTVSASAVLFASFYSLQMVFQRCLGTVRLHSGMPLQLLAPVGFCATASSLYLSQITEDRVRRETYDYTFEPKHPVMKLFSSSESEKDKKRRLLLGLGLYMILERGLFKAAFPSSVIAIGVFGNAFNRIRYSVPATSELTTESQRSVIQTLGRRFGCHQCGDRQIGRRVGFIADHMPPTRQALLQSQVWWRKMLGIKVL
ncbi:hypothetical protein EON65_23930 [archaeon]|nr:MAG: hypothetical protein EON65_23930 [archaeon]